MATPQVPDEEPDDARLDCRLERRQLARAAKGAIHVVDVADEADHEVVLLLRLREHLEVDVADGIRAV